MSEVSDQRLAELIHDFAQMQLVSSNYSGDIDSCLAELQSLRQQLREAGPALEWAANELDIYDASLDPQTRSQHAARLRALLNTTGEK